MAVVHSCIIMCSSATAAAAMQQQAQQQAVLALSADEQQQQLLLPLPAAPPPPPFPWTPNFRHEGAWVGASLESSPIYFNGKLYLMQSQMGPFPRNGSNGAHSFFCVMDGKTGEEISCPPSSTAHAFCSAIVDHTGPGPETAWVFCSAWDRANQTTCTTPMWGCGACALARSNQSECYVGAWSSTDLRTWTGPSKIITLPAPVTVPNVAVSMIPPRSKMPVEERRRGAAGLGLVLGPRSVEATKSSYSY